MSDRHKRFGLRVLNDMVTSNHIRLPVQDGHGDVICRSMQLAAARTAQQYNRRKARQGTFREDSYHVTAIKTDAHLHRCVVCMDLNMVRAGVVTHPPEWAHSGYNEFRHPPKRDRLIALDSLRRLCRLSSTAPFQGAQSEWIGSALAAREATRQARWFESVAVASERRGK